MPKNQKSDADRLSTCVVAAERAIAGSVAMIGWLDSRWRAHVINAARNVMSHGVALTAPSGIGLRVRLQLAAGRESRGAAGRLPPAAGCIASFITP